MDDNGLYYKYVCQYVCACVNRLCIYIYIVLYILDTCICNFLVSRKMRHNHEYPQILHCDNDRKRENGGSVSSRVKAMEYSTSGQNTIGMGHHP